MVPSNLERYGLSEARFSCSLMRSEAFRWAFYDLLILVGCKVLGLSFQYSLLPYNTPRKELPAIPTLPDFKGLSNVPEVVNRLLAREKLRPRVGPKVLTVEGQGVLVSRGVGFRRRWKTFFEQANS